MMPKFSWGWFAFWCGALLAGVLIAMVTGQYIRMTLSVFFLPVVTAWLIINTVRVIGLTHMISGERPAETINQPPLPFPKDGPLAKAAINLGKELDHLGFRLIGQTHVNMPMDLSIQAWYFGHVVQPIHAEIVFTANKPIVYLHTVFDDQSTVVTGWPEFEHMRGQNLWLSRVRKDLATTFTLHQQLANRFATENSVRPLRLTNLRVVLRWSRIYRDLYTHRQLRRPIIQSIIELLWALIAFIIFGVDIWADFSDVLLAPAVEAGMGMVFLLAFFIFLIYQTLSTPKDSASALLKYP